MSFCVPPGLRACGRGMRATNACLAEGATSGQAGQLNFRETEVQIDDIRTYVDVYLHTYFRRAIVVCRHYTYHSRMHGFDLRE